MFKILSLTSALIFCVSSAQAGSISGTIKFTGKVPKMEAFKTGKFRKACGPEIPNESLIIEKQKVTNTVIWLSGKSARKFKPKPEHRVLDQKNCRYVPHVIAMPKESELLITTSDPINHNIHTYSFDNDPINVMFTPGQEYEQEFEEPEVVKVECDLHSWMQAWIVVTPNSYYALTGADGAYEIKKIPSGKYRLHIWHEYFGEMTRDIEIKEGGLTLDFDLAEIAPQVSKN